MSDTKRLPNRLKQMTYSEVNGNFLPNHPRETQIPPTLSLTFTFFVSDLLFTLFDVRRLWRRERADFVLFLYEPPHDKINRMTVRPAKTQISMGIRPV